MPTPVGIYVATSNMLAQRDRLQVVADNVANVNTTGFKKQNQDFATVLGRHQGAQVAEFVRRDPPRTIFANGALAPTGNPFDIGLIGEGFFAVQNGDQVVYTRAGQLTRTVEGTLVTPEGFPILDSNNAAIALPLDAQKITISPDGTVSADNENIGQIGVFRFEPEQQKQLMRAGLAGYIPTGDATAVAAEDGYQISQGFLESSTVQATEEVTNMIEANRRYQSALRLMNTLEDLEQRGIREISRSPQ